MSAQFTTRAQGTLLLLAAFVLLAPPNAQAQRYRVTVSPSAAAGLNSTGQVTGSLGSFQGAFLSGPNGASPAGIGSIDCAFPGDDPADCQFNVGLGVNDAGVVVGVGQNSSAGGYAFYSGNNGAGLTRVLGTGPSGSRLRAVNNAGQATGYVEEGPNPSVGTRFAVLYDIAGQSYAKLTTGAGEGFAINATGEVGGGGPQTGFNGQFAFVTGDNGAGITWLPRPEGDDFMEVSGINDLGHYVGYTGVFSNNAYLPFVDFGGGLSFAVIAPLPGNNAHQALAINNAGTVVGTSGGAPFVWDAVRGTRDLRTLVIPGTIADICSRATAINQRGQILCDGNLLTLLAAPSDFDGDGRSDILWRNSGTGENYLYPMDGTAILGTEGYLRTVADQAWRVAGVGDFDGDGNADVLWRNSGTGENYVYLMDGTTIAGEGYLRTVADPDWQVAGVGDFDGDGNADILWRNNATGENYLYPMSGLAILGTEGYLRTVADLDWNVAGVGDMDGDGKADILWRNSDTGENYLYPMNGTAILGTEGYLRTVADQNWQVTGTGDYDGDGKADVLWRNAQTGDNYLYPMNGTTILVTEGYLRTVADIDWKIAGGPLDEQSPAIGIYSISPPIQYSCAFGFFQLDIGSFAFTKPASQLRVTGAPAGPSAAMFGLEDGNSFIVQATIPGDATETHTLSGTFAPGGLSWSGTYQFGCTGSCIDCTFQQFPVTATRQ
jgi:hypothetical protein